MEGLGATLHTPPLHGKRRMFEAELCEELRCSPAARAEHPRDLRIGAQSPLDQLTADAPATMRWCDHKHGEVAVGLAIGDGANKAHDLAFDNCDVSDL